MTRRILLVGATGVFGSRLARLLAALPEIELVVAARRPAELAALRDALAPNARAALIVQVFDRQRPEDLAAIRPWLVIDAAGPFQESGYDLALAAVGCGAHYVDLADGRGFVAGFPAALDAPAKAAGVLAVTGASSTPALSHAALEIVTAGWQRIDRVTTAISPGARAPRGLAVVQGILSYVGQPVRVFRGGAWSSMPGWSGLRRLDMPGLGYRLAALCETPDLDLLPQRFTIRDDALFLAGLELAPLQLGLAALGLLVRARLLRSLVPLARPLRAMAGLLVPFGTDRGGMIVLAEGIDSAGRAIRARWALWAEANAGPNVPAVPAAALVRALLAGRVAHTGGTACVGLLPLDAILRELDGLPIRTRRDESHVDNPVLFRRLLGRRFDALPPAVRRVHGAERAASFRGRAVTRAGGSLVARVIRRLLGLPGNGHTTVTAKLVPDQGAEIWTRRFGTAAFASRLVATDRLGVFEERIGLLRFRFRMEPTETGVIWQLVGWRFAGLSLPMAAAPVARARADEIGGRYRFRVAVAHPWIGLLFAYRGDLA